MCDALLLTFHVSESRSSGGIELDLASCEGIEVDVEIN